LGQAFRRLGSEVTVISRDFLPKEEPHTAEVVQASFRRDGMRLELGAVIHAVERRDSGTLVTYEVDGERRTAVADQVLLGAGRAPNVEGLGLEQVGVEFSQHG